MEVSLPDIIGEYLDTPARFEIDGVQLAGYFEPAKIAPEQITHLFLFIQNALNAPVKINVKIEMPQTRGLFRGGRPLLTVQEPAFQLKLAEAEVGLLTLPVTTTEHIVEGEHLLTIELKIVSGANPQRVRPTKSRGKLTKSLIDSPVGLNLVSSLGSTYVVKPVKTVAFPLEVAGEPDPPERTSDLKHKYETVWVKADSETFTRSIHELNLRQVKLKSELNVESLYVNLYAESTIRFADAGLPLRIGEAIVLAKILTYSGQYFLANPKLYNGLLVPIWERAFEAGVDTTDGIQVIRTAGYHHLLKISIAISFGILAKSVGRHYWPLVERQAVTNYIADSIEDGQEIDEDFLYLPLLMAGTQIFNKLKFDDEDPRQSLALIKKAYEARPDLFGDEEMAQANKIYKHILKKAMR